MKKIIPFEKKIEFQSMIGEITSISVDEHLKFTDESTIKGNLEVNGTYKRTEASRIEEEFNYDIPTEIILTERLELSTVKLDIEDFYYEIEEDNILNCHIDLSVEGMEIVEYEEEVNYELKEEEKEVEELRECDGDKIEEKVVDEQVKKIDEVVEENEVKENIEIQETEKIEEVEENEENVGSLFLSLKDSEETFSTYSVYIIREETTIDSIMEKYKVTKEELESYNDLNSISVGSKIIIPMKNDTV